MAYLCYTHRGGVAQTLGVKSPCAWTRAHRALVRLTWVVECKRGQKRKSEAHLGCGVQTRPKLYVGPPSLRLLAACMAACTRAHHALKYMVHTGSLCTGTQNHLMHGRIKDKGVMGQGGQAGQTKQMSDN
eukprot:1154096-Pelagomonas_calceolata.AAC.1